MNKKTLLQHGVIPVLSGLTICVSVHAAPSNATGDPAAAESGRIPGSTRYFPEELIPQKVRFYAQDQPVLENPWISVPRAAGFDNQDDYLLSVYPSLKELPESERAAALRGIKRTLTPILEQSADGRENPVYAELQQTYATASNLKRINDGALLADLYFHAQSPLRNAPPEVREALFERLVELTFQGIDPDAIEPRGKGNQAWGGEYMLGKILGPYLMLEIFRPEALTMDQRRTLNRVLMHPFFGFNGQLGITGFTQELLSGILNKQVFTYNNLLCAASLMELQMARYPESENLWPGFSRELPDFFRDTLAEIARNYHNGLMGDGATRYVPGYTHAYYYEGPQMEQLMRNYLNTYDEGDPVLMQANEVLKDRIVAIGNYYEQTAFRVIEDQDDSHHQSNRAQMSEAKSFGNELVHRPSDPTIHWALANLTGNRWLRQTGPALQAQRTFENPKSAMQTPGPDLALASVWNPKVTIGPDASAGPGFRQNYIFWDRNNLGATGKYDNWAFHLIGRGMVGRRPNPEANVGALFEKDTFAGFVARSAGSPPAENGLRTDHRLAHLAYVGIFPEKTRFWGSVKIAHPKSNGIVPGYAPHWDDARWSATVTDGFAVQTSSARADSTDAVCREVWLATPHGAVGLLGGAVSEDPKNGDGYARLSFLVQGFFGTRIRSYRKQDGFLAEQIPSPITFPTITPGGNGFDFVNQRVRVLEQNFTDGPVFAHLQEDKDFYPTDKRSLEMRGLDELSNADNESHGAVTREVQVRGRFTDGRKPQAVVAVHTGDVENPPTACRISDIPGVEGEYLAMAARDGDTGYLVIYNSGGEPLQLSKWDLSKGLVGESMLLEGLNAQSEVRFYRSGARFRPDFLGNIEVNPEADKEDEVVHGSVVQQPPLQSLAEAIKEGIPPHGHVVIVTGGQEFKTGGPGFEVRPTIAEWRFLPELREGTKTRELTSQASALSGGEQTEIDAVRVDTAGTLTANALAMPASGTVRFWIKPEAGFNSQSSLLFASGGSPAWEVWLKDKQLVVRCAEGGQSVARSFVGELNSDIWQQIVLTYQSADPDTWHLRVNDALRSASADAPTLPTPVGELCVGKNIAASFKDLAVHAAALSPGELNFLHDREQPANFNRINISGIPANVWVNGNRVNEESQPELVDTNKLTRHLKQGTNVIAIEFDGALKDAKGRSTPGLSPVVDLWIRGRNLTAEGAGFNSGWETIVVPRNDVGSRLLAAYDTQIKRQMEHLASRGKSTKEYRQAGWRPVAYDRPWLGRNDALPWEPVSWKAPGESGCMSPILQSAQGQRLMRFTFDLDDRGVPRPFDSSALVPKTSELQ